MSHFFAYQDEPLASRVKRIILQTIQMDCFFRKQSKAPIFNISHQFSPQIFRIKRCFRKLYPYSLVQPWKQIRWDLSNNWKKRRKDFSKSTLVTMIMLPVWLCYRAIYCMRFSLLCRWLELPALRYFKNTMQTLTEWRKYLHNS